MRNRSVHGITRDEYLATPHLYAVRGEQLPQARLDADTVRRIRRNWCGWTARQWAEHLGVHRRTVENVQHYVTWRHVSDE